MTLYERLYKLTTTVIADPEVMLEEFLPYLQVIADFKYTKQDPEWHGEGDVHIHTLSVANELYHLLEMDENAHIEGEDRLVLIVATLLHDVAKPFTTRVREIKGKDRIVAPRHEEKGQSYLCLRLLDAGFPYTVIHRIVTLVALHGKPKRMVSECDKGAFLNLNRRCNTELLYLLEMADMKGRISDDRQDNIDMMDLFKLYCKDFGAWGETRFHPWGEYRSYNDWDDHIVTNLPKTSEPFQRFMKKALYKSYQDLEDGLISTPHEAVAKSYVFKDGFSHVVVLSGISGSGKSTLIKKEYPDYNIISLDGIRGELFGDESEQGNVGQVLQLAKERLRECLRNNENVVWDATSLRRDFRTQVTQLVRDYNGFSTIVFIYCPIKQALENNKNRDRVVPENVIKKQIDSLEYPMIDECDELIIKGGLQC